MTVLAQLKTLNQGDLIEVGWFDSSFTGGWREVIEIEEILNEPMMGTPCSTTGYYFAHNKNKLIVCMSKSAIVESEWGEVYTIPLVNIGMLDILKKINNG